MASITGVFTILDRASAPMRQMEHQALRTMAAIEGVGKAQDRASGSSHSAGRRMEETARSMKTVERAAKQTERATAGAGREMKNLDRNARSAHGGLDGLAVKLGKVNQVLKFMGTVLGLAKLPAMGVGIAVLAQAIGTLAGGVTALLPGLGQAMGILGAAPQTAMAAAQGLGTFKLALGGVADALKAGMALQQNFGQAMQDSAEAHIQAVHAVQEAEYGLMVSQRSVTQAQVALTEARREAIRNLQDLRLAALGADLSQQRSVLALRMAQQELANAAVNPQTTDLQMSDMNLTVAESSLQVQQANLNQARSHQDLHRAQHRGVSGNLQVVAAQNSLTDALHSQKDATFALAEAQRALMREQQRGTGLVATYRQALKNLSPPARAFVQHLVAMRPALQHLRGEAAAGLFPGLSRAVDNAARALPMIERVMRRTGQAMGTEIASQSARFTTAGRQRDLEGLGNMNATIVQRMIRGFGNLGSALLDFMVAAKPFTNWLTRSILLFTQHVAAWSKARRESGAWASQLDRTKGRLQQFWQIFKDFGSTLMNVFRAATPLGDRLWAGAATGAKHMKEWTGSTQGMSRMRDWFNRLYTPLHALGKLTKDLAVAWAHITVSAGFTASINNLDKGVGPLESLFKTGASLGPSLANVLVSILNFFNDLPVSSVKVLLDMVSGVFKALDLIIQKVPGAKYALTGLLLAGAMAKALKMVKALVGSWGGLFDLWRRAPMPPECGCGPGIGPGGPGGGPRGGAPGGGMPPPIPGERVPGLVAPIESMPRTPWFRSRSVGVRGIDGAYSVVEQPSWLARGAGRVGSLASGFGRGVGSLWSGARALPSALGMFRGGVGAGRAGLGVWGRGMQAAFRGSGGAGRLAALAEGGGVLGRGAGMLGRVGGIAGRFAAPLTLLSMAAGAFSGGQRWGNFNGVGYGALDALDMGTGGFSNWFDPGADRQGRTVHEQQALGMALKRAQHAGGPKAQMASLNQMINSKNVLGMGSDALDMGDPNSKEYKKHIANIMRGLRAARGQLVARDTAAADTAVQKLQQVMGVYASHGKVGQGQRAVVADFQKNFHDASMAGKKELSAGVATWIEQLSHGNAQQRKLSRALASDVKNTWSDMGQHIQLVNGSILYGSQQEWKGIAQALKDPVEKAQEAVNKSFTKLQQKAVGSLMAMGYTRHQAQSIVAGNEKGGLMRYTPGQVSAKTGSGQLSIQSQSNRNAQGYAGGGRIYGQGLADTIPIAPGAMAAPGELIVNRHTERRLDGLLGAFGTSLGREVAGETHRHAQAFASGGRYGGVTPGLAKLIANLDSRGFSHGSTTGGTHASGSYHYRGEAVDFGDASNNMQKLWNIVFPQRGKFAELFGPSYLHPKPTLMHYGAGFSDGALQSQHNNHIHIALTGGAPMLGAGGLLASVGTGQAIDLTKALLKPQRSGMPGIPGALADAAMNSFAAGINRNIKRAQGAGGGALAGVTGATGSARKNMALGHKMMLAMGWGENQWPSLRSLWNQESGWLPKTNPSSGAYGIPQALGHGHPYNLNDIPAQLRWGLNYIKGRYGSPGGAWAHEQSHNWYATGGRLSYDPNFQIGIDPGRKMTGGSSGGGSVGAGSGGPYDHAYPSHHGFAGAKLPAKVVQDLAAQAGLPNWFWKIAKGESGFEPGIIGDDPNGYSHGRGLYQMTPEVWSGGMRKQIESMGSYFDPWTNTLMAKYLYDHAPSKTPRTHGFPWYGTRYLAGGGRSGPDWGGWHAQGGTFNVSRPTLFGAGENGRETVTVTRPGDRGTGGRTPVHVHIAKIENHREGDIRKHVQKEIEGLVDDLHLVGTMED